MYNRRLVFAAACAGMFLFGIVMISLGSLLPTLTSKFALNEVAAGSLASLLPFGILAGSLVFGPVVDRYGYKSLLAVCTVLVFLSLEGIALTQVFVFLQVSIFVIGFGGGVLNGATNALVADISSEGRGASLSLLGVFFGIGALGMPAILGLLSRNFSHETIFAGVGVIVLFVAVFFVAIRFPVPKQAQRFPLVKGISLIKDATLMLFGFILFFESGMEGIVNNWTTTFLHQEVGATADEALFALSWFVVGLVAARLVLSRVLKHVSMWIALFVSTGLVLVGGVLLMSAGVYGTAVAGLVLLGIGFAAVFPVVLGRIGDIYAGLAGTAFSLALVIALVGNMVLNYLVGIIAHVYGIKDFPAIVLASLCIMVLLMLVARKRVLTIPRQ
jgi:FHS family glucose/mannose:H+ symporter-like MFS transporter